MDDSVQDKLFEMFEDEGGVSALDLICGIIIVAKGTAAEKAKTVFKAYDFNHENSIGLDELTIMLMATANGNAKLHGMPTKSESFWRGIAVTCSAGRGACSLDTWLTWLADFLDADLSLDPASPSAITLDDAVAKFGIT